MKIVTAEEMRQIEQECAKIGLPPDVLMENAGKAVAEEVRHILRTVDRQHILCLIGPGNNGGDGLVAARYLHDWGAAVSVYLCAQRAPKDLNLELVQQRGIICTDGGKDENLTQFDRLLAEAGCVVDALFGTGKVRPLQGIYQQVLDRVAQVKSQKPKLRIISVDLPSGLDANSGAIDLHSPYADDTITLGFPKPGLFCFPGAERVGRLTVADIGIPDHFAAGITTELMTDKWAKAVLPKRPLDANKGTFGKVLVVAGSINYIGAAYLACNGAMRVGAGLVTLAIALSLQPILAAKQTEATYLPLPEAQPGTISPQATTIIRQQCANYDVWLVGCGLGQSQPVVEFVSSLLFSEGLPVLVLDADALNTLARIPNWWQRLSDKTILTPHPGEMARLAGITVKEVQSDRVGIAKELARQWHKIVVLKGAYTVVAEPEGQAKISPFANPGLASAGTGDVLAGAIAGLVAQGLSLYDAAALGAYLHGKAGERVKNIMGDAGMVASDLLPVLPLVIKELKETA